MIVVIHHGVGRKTTVDKMSFLISLCAKMYIFCNRTEYIHWESGRTLVRFCLSLPMSSCDKWANQSRSDLCLFTNQTDHTSSLIGQFERISRFRKDRWIHSLIDHMVTTINLPTKGKIFTFMGYFQPTSWERTCQKTPWSIINLLVFRFNYMQSLVLQQVHKQSSFVDQRFYSKKRASNLA